MTANNNTPNNQAKPLKAAIRFDDNINNTPSPTPTLKSQQVLDSDLTLEEIPASELEQTLEQLAKQKNVPKKSRSILLRLGLITLGAAAVIELGQFLWNSWQESPILAGLFMTGIGCLSIATLRLIFRELGSLKRLRGVHHFQERAAQLLASEQQGEGVVFCEKLAKRCNHDKHDCFQQWTAQLTNVHTDKETLQLYNHTVLSAFDQQAKHTVNRSASESALFIAISPLALTDMMIMMLRNVKLINDIAAIYGVNLGYWSRIKLVKSVLFNVFFAGASELIADLGMELLGTELAGKLSARMAQGIGAGLMTARLGYQTMALCRPLAFTEQERPKLKQIHQQLLTELKQTLWQTSTQSLKNSIKQKDPF
ncbi:YcjF family protein [Zooshikella sp. RANM57]|uniref:YcjF family protein n=1 Tax=Zooshikella sp. RANM57 TaxID=3425863 RepID=UPI003D6ECB70